MVAQSIPELVEDYIEAKDCEGARSVLRAEESSMSHAESSRLWERIRSTERVLETARLDTEV